MTTEQNTAELTKNMESAIDLAANVAAEARRQLKDYTKSVKNAAAKLEAANNRVPGATDEEKELIRISSKAASSVAGTLIDFADAAFEQMRDGSKDTRDKALSLVRKVVKLAVDDSLEGLFDGPPQAASPTSAALVLTGSDACERVYLPTAATPKTLNLHLAGDLGVNIEVSAGRNPAQVLSGKAKGRNRASFQLSGSRPSLTVRIPHQAKITRVAVALLHLSGAYAQVVTLTVRPAPP
jgi:hypothetical protein